MDTKEFENYYYLKEELIDFCRSQQIPSSGSKQEISKRILHYLQIGKVIQPTIRKKPAPRPKKITHESIIEENIVCSENHRDFFKQEIGQSFKFKVAFQQWLKNNTGKSYSDAVAAYYEVANKKTTNIDSQFKYNIYIRDFFSDNPKLTLKDAIKCWKFKKSQPGQSNYEKGDLKVL